MTGSRRTIVSFHAHPDDEVLLTGGTLARAAAAGHRVVLVTATSGGAGLAHGRVAGQGLSEVRAAELTGAAEILGCARVELLGFPDSGMDGTAGGGEGGPNFSQLSTQVIALRLAEILREERADVLTTYDEHGGYGHPDHRQVHRAGSLAARIAGTRTVLEATVDRDLLLRAIRVARLAGALGGIAVPTLDSAYLPRHRLTHRVDVRAFADVKRSAMAEHLSQTGSPTDDQRTLALLLRLPRPLFRMLMGREWFAERERHPTARLAGDLLPNLCW